MQFLWLNLKRAIHRLIRFTASRPLPVKILTLALALGTVAAVLSSILFFAVWLGIFGRVPGREELKTLRNPIASEVYSADSVLLGRYFIQERSNLKAEDVPKFVPDLLLVTEDVRFYDHHGIDVRSLFRVLFKTILLQRETSGGGSTLTQQLAKNLYPRKTYWIASSPISKFQEMIIAHRLESVYDKKTILLLYLNTIPFGENTFGLEAASQRFFSKPTKKLSIEQAAVLIGMLKANHYYNPRLFPEHALLRRNVVLGQMKKYDRLPERKVDSLQAIPIRLSYNMITHHAGLAPYFREYLRPQLVQWCENFNRENNQDLNLYKDGLKIYTTIDSRLQRHAEAALVSQMKVLQKRFLEHWSKSEPWEKNISIVDEAVRRSDRYKKLKDQGMSDVEIRATFDTPGPMTILTVGGLKEVKMSPLDSIKHYLRFLQAGMLAIEPSTGAIRIWVGGINHEYFQYDHVRAGTRRQVGSTFKPIVYAAALEEGAKPCNFISAEKTVYTNVEGWEPENAEENYGMKYSMPGALAYSVNTVSIRVLEEAGIDKTIDLAHRMGISSPLDPVPSLALGTADVSMMEMVGAYACFANEGMAVIPYTTSAITNHRDSVLARFKKTPPKRALTPESAGMILHMLRRAVNEGTSSSLRTQFGLHNDIAGKTGTTQSNADGWFIGITPKLVIGTWVGADDPRIRFRSTALGQGARTALPIMGEFLQRCNADPKVHEFASARFHEPTPSIARKISCDLVKEDHHFLRDLFVKEPREVKREFGKPKKKNFLQRLFGA